MGNAGKSLASALILVIVVSCASLSGYLPKALAQTGTNVSGLISSDTVWTQASSPISFTGPVAVNQGVTLSLQAGTTVNLNNYYLRVNGTLSAIGTANSKINFNGGQITFTNLSNGWNEQTNSGCIIENSIINQTSISNSNPIKIDNCIINSKSGQVTVSSSIITNNIVNGYLNSQAPTPSLGQNNAPVDTSIISGNTVNGNLVIGAVYLGAVTAPSEACSVFNNTVYGSIITGSPQDVPQIFNNTVSQGGIGCDGYASIFNNYIYGCSNGISLFTERVFGGYLPCYATVQNNIIAGNSYGIAISLSDLEGGLGQQYCPTILNNTITGNTIGISLNGFGYSATPTIKYNNLQNSQNYTFYLQESNNADLTNNWWGTTNQQAINQSIYDFKNDFNLGTVSFIPYLTAPNPQTPTTTQPYPTPTPTPTHQTITLNPSIGSPGTTVNATLSGFPANSAINIVFGTTNVGTIAPATGSGTFQFTVPQVPLGQYNVTATGTSGGTATTFFFLGQAFTTSPTPTPTTTLTQTPTLSPTLTSTLSPAKGPPSTSSLLLIIAIILVVIVLLLAIIVAQFIFIRKQKTNLNSTKTEIVITRNNRKTSYENTNL